MGKGASRISRLIRKTCTFQDAVSFLNSQFLRRVKKPSALSLPGENRHLNISENRKSGKDVRYLK